MVYEIYLNKPVKIKRSSATSLNTEVLTTVGQYHYLGKHRGTHVILPSSTS